jgi:hypothetical protein
MSSGFIPENGFAQMDRNHRLQTPNKLKFYVLLPVALFGHDLKEGVEFVTSLNHSGTVDGVIGKTEENFR